MNPLRRVAGAVSSLPPGTHFARMALAIARAKGDRMGAVEIASSAWGAASLPALILRAAVTAGEFDPAWAGSIAEHHIAASEFVEALRPLTLLGRMSGFRRAPTNVRNPTRHGRLRRRLGRRGQTDRRQQTCARHAADRSFQDHRHSCEHRGADRAVVARDASGLEKCPASSHISAMLPMGQSGMMAP